MSQQNRPMKMPHQNAKNRRMLHATFYAITAAFPLIASPPIANAQSVTMPSAKVPSTPTASDAIAPQHSSILLEDRSLADARREANADAPIFTLTEAIGLALQNNPQHDAALAAVRAARARIKTAKAGGGLQVNLGGEATGQHAFGFPDGSTTGGGFGSSGDTTSDHWTHSESLSATATLPIFTGGRVSANKAIARYSAEAQQAQALQVDQQLVYNTTLAYLSILRSEQLLEVTKANLDVARERQRISQVRYDAGAAAKLEVLQADADLAAARQQRIVASNSLGQSNAALNTLLGRAPDTPLRVEPITQLTLPSPLVVTPSAAPLATTATVRASSSGASDVGTGGVSTVSTDSSTNIASSSQLQLAASQSRNSLAVTEAQIKAAEASVGVARSARRPSIGANILGMLRNPLTFAGRFLLSVGASVAQTLFDSGKSSGQIREALATVDQLRSQYKGQQLAVANDIEQSLLDLDSSQKRLNSTQTGVTAAQEALRAAQLGYSAGVTTSVEVSNAQAALLTAQTDAVNARFDLAAAQAQLAAAVGVVPLEGEVAYKRATREVQEGRKQKIEDGKQKAGDGR